MESVVCLKKLQSFLRSTLVGWEGLWGSNVGVSLSDLSFDDWHDLTYVL